MLYCPFLCLWCFLVLSLLLLATGFDFVSWTMDCRFFHILYAYSSQSKNISSPVSTWSHKLWFLNPNIFAIWWWIPLIFHVKNIKSNRVHGLKYVRSKTLDCKDIGVDSIPFHYLFKGSVRAYKVYFFALTIFSEKKIVYLWEKNFIWERESLEKTAV